MHPFRLFIRKFKQDKLFTTLNLFGLTIGLSAFIYMSSYIRFEKSFEEFNKNSGLVYRVTSQKTQNNTDLERKSSGPVILKEHLLQSHPEINKATRINILEAHRLIVRIDHDPDNVKTYVEKLGFHAEKDFFEIFGTPLIQGNPETALDGPNKIVLTKTAANKYFGDVNPIGKTLTLTDDFEMVYEITGLVDNAPLNSHFQYDFLISFDTFVKQRPHWRWTAWDWDYFHTYILVDDGTDPIELEEKINASVAQAGRSAFEMRGYTLDFELQNIADIHLTSHLGRELGTNGNGELLSYLEIIAYFILFLAWINYINLATAIANLRAKEVGVRKIIGADRVSLTFQYLAEAFVYNLLALLAAFGLIILSGPTLESVTGYRIDLSELIDANGVYFLMTTLVLGTIGSGLYPAFFLSNISVITALRGKYSHSKQGLLVRKGLVVFQFTLALTLMILTFGIFSQVNFMRERETGVDIDQVLITNMPNVRNETFWRDYDRFKNLLKQKSYVTEVTTSREIPGTYLNMVESFKRGEQLREEAQILKFVWVDYDFFDLYGLELAAGRPFLEENQTDVRDGVMFTEEAIKRLGFASAEEAIDQPVDWVRNRGEIDPFKVVGVVKDFEQEANNEPQAIIYIMNRRWSSWFVTNFIAIKMNNTANMENQINEIRQLHNTIYSHDSFDYFFQDDHYNRLYQSDLKFGKIFSFFSILTLCITVLGLFGLTAFLVVTRKKEVSVRRVLGANFNHLLRSFITGYMRDMGLATLISLPIAFLLLSSWMDRFIDRVDFGLYIYVIPVLVLLLMTSVILIYHLLQTIQQNPAQVIREN